MLIAIVLAGLILAPAMPFVVKTFKERAGWVIALLPALITLAGSITNSDSRTGSAKRLAMGSQSGFNPGFSPGWISVVVCLVDQWDRDLDRNLCRCLFKEHGDLGRFYLYLLIFMVAMLGVVLADNLLVLFVFWELTSISSDPAIGFNHDQTASRAGALKALLITGSGGLVMMAWALSSWDKWREPTPSVNYPRICQKVGYMCPCYC